MKTPPARNLTPCLTRLAAGFCLALTLPAYNAGAALQYWNNNSPSAASSGNWDTTSSFWSVGPALTNTVAPFGSGNIACFAAGTAGITAMTITVPAGITCGGISNVNAGAVVTTLTFTGPGPINLSGGANPFWCGPSGSDNLVFNTPIAGSGQLVQHALGALSLYATNSYTGGTAMTAPQLIYYNNNYAFGSGTISVTVGGGAIVNGSLPEVALVVTNAWSFTAANLTLNIVGGGLVGGVPGTTFTGNFTLPSSGNTLLYTGGSGQPSVDEITGVISGTSGLIVEDYGILELAGVNTYSGNTAILSPGPGTLMITAAGSLGAGNYVGNITNNGTFIYNSSAAQTLSGVISGSGTLSKTGSGQLTLTGANTFTGGTTNSTGLLLVIGGLSGNVTVTAGTLDASSSSSLSGANFTVTGGTLELDSATVITSPSATIDLPTTSTGTVNLNFSGTCTVLALNFGGVSAVDGTWGAVGSGATHTSSAFTGTGILSVESSTSAAYYWDANGSDAHDSHNDAGGGSGNWDNATANWWVSGGADTAWQGGYPAYFGGTAGTVTVAANVAPSSMTFTAPGYTVTSPGDYTISVANPATPVSVPAGTTTISAPIAGEGLIVSGPGTLVLTGSNTYTAGTLISNQATVSVSALDDSVTDGISTGTFTFGGGTLAYTGASTATTTRHFLGVPSTTNAVDVPAGISLTLNGQINGNSPGWLINKTGAGTLILGGTGDNSWLGMNVMAGTVVCDKTVTGSCLGGPISVSSGATLQLSGAGYGKEIYGGNTTPVSIYNGGLFDLNGQSNTLYTLAMGGTGLGGGVLINSAAGTSSEIVAPTLPAGFTLTANTTIGGSGNITLFGNISGNYAITQAGSGLLTLAGTNTFYGGLTLNPNTSVELATNSVSDAGPGPISLGANSTLLVDIAFTNAATLGNPITGGPTTSIDVVETPYTTTAFSGDLLGFMGQLNCPASTTSGKVEFGTSEEFNINPAAIINVSNGATIWVVNHNVVVPCTVNFFGTGNGEAYGALRLEAGALISGPVHLYGTTTMGNGQSGATVLGAISGVISSVGGSYGITFTAEPGTIQLQGANTYTGTTTLNGGVVQLDSVETPGTSGPLGNSAASNPGSVVLNGGLLQFTSVNNHDYSGRFSTAPGQKFYFDVNGQTVTVANPLSSSAGGLGVQSTIAGGTLVMNAANTYTSNSIIAGGTLVLNSAETIGSSGPLGSSPAVVAPGSAVGSIVMSGGKLQFSSVNQNDYSGRFSTNNSQSFNFDVNGQNVSFANGLTSSNGTLTLSSTAGGGSLTLNSTNNYTNTTTISAATTLFVSGAGDLGNNIAAGGGFYIANINDQGTFNFGSSANQSLLGAITGNGSLIKSGTGTLVLSSSNNAYYGGTTVSNGTLNITNTGAIAGNVTVAGGVLELCNSTALSPSAVLTLPTSPAVNSVNLNFLGTLIINSLMFGTNSMPAGTYGAIGNASVTYQNAAFTGSGILNVQAQVAYWDPGSLITGPGSGGSGSWDTGSSDWWVSGSTDSIWNETNIAYFAGTAGTVSVNANVSASGLSFAVPNYSIGGSSTLTLLNETINGTPMITIPGGNTAISCPMASSTTTNSIIISGPGTLTLSADNSAISNNIEVTGGGTLSVNSIEDSGNGSSAIGGGANLELLNANLAFTGTSGQSARHVTISGSMSNVISVLPGNTLELDGQVQNISASAPQVLVFNGGGTLILGGTLDNAGLDMAINAGKVVINKTSASGVHGIGGGTSTIASGAELQLSDSGGGGYPGGGYDLYSGTILTVASGGMLDLNNQSDSPSTLTISGTGIGGAGALINSGTTESYLNNGGSGVVLTGNTTIGGSGAIQLEGIISGLGSSLTYIGTGSFTTELYLSGANTWSGGLIIASGSMVSLTNVNSAGSGPITIQDGGTLELSGSGTYGSSYFNPVSGDANTKINMAMPGAGQVNVFLDYNLTNFYGTIDVGYLANGTYSQGGQMILNNIANEAYPINPGATWQIENGVTLDFQAPCTANPAQVIVKGIGNNIYGSLRLDACNQEGNVLLAGYNCQIGDGNTPVGASTISGVISDGGAGYGFTKVGAANNIIILTAANTYSGPTTVSNGVLALAGSGSIADSSSLNLNGNTTFDVSAVTGGSYSFGASQSINCYGTATIGGSVNLGSGAPLTLQCTNTGTGLIITNGTLTLNNNPINVTVYNSAGTPISPVPGSYPLITTVASITGTGHGIVSGTVSGSPLNITGGLNSEFNATLSITGNTLYMIVSASAPTIIGQEPPSAGGPATTLYAGANPNYSVQAVGLAPLQYLWYTNGVLVGYGTNSLMTLTNVGIGSLSTYCVVSNTASYTPAASLVWTANVVADPAQPYPALVLASKPLGYWRLDEATGTSPNNGVIAQDYFGNNDGVYSNVWLYASPGYGANTDPAEGAMQVGNVGTGADNDAYGIPNINFGSPSGTSPTFTIEAWVNGTLQTQDAGIVSLGYGGGGEQFDLDTGSDGYPGNNHAFRFFIRDASGGTHGSTSAITPGGGWNHLVGVCDESNGVVTLYVNGVIANSGSGFINPGSGLLSSTRNIIIGSRSSNANTNNNFQFAGYIDDVSVYNYAMSATQVVAHYVAAGVPPYFAQLPPTTVNADQGQTLTLPAIILGTPPLNYTWTDLSANTVISSGSTNGNVITASELVSSVPSSWNGDTLSLTVNNAYGSTNIMVSFNVASFLQASLVPDTNLSLVAGESYTYTVAASGAVPVTYQWSANGVQVTGATNDTFTGTAVLGTTTYSCLVSNPVGTTNLSATLTGLPYLALDWTGSGWIGNQSGTYNSAELANGVLTLTDGGGSEARSEFFDARQYIGAFEASFTYQAGGSKGADGVAFCIQNDSRGAAALGGDGGALGVSGITPSAELELNIYSSQGVGFSFTNNGGNQHYVAFPAGTISLASGDPINVDITYLGGQMTVAFSDPVASTSFVTNFNVNLTQLVNTNEAFVGFTGGDGASTSVQTISNFSFISVMYLSAQPAGANMVLCWPNDISLYQLQSSTSLTSPNWVNVSSPVSVVNGMNQVTVPATAGAQQFYRLILQ